MQKLKKFAKILFSSSRVVKLCSLNTNLAQLYVPFRIDYPLNSALSKTSTRDSVRDKKLKSWWSMLSLICSFCFWTRTWKLLFSDLEPWPRASSKQHPFCSWPGAPGYRLATHYSAQLWSWTSTQSWMTNDLLSSTTTSGVRGSWEYCTGGKLLSISPIMGQIKHILLLCSHLGNHSHD